MSTLADRKTLFISDLHLEESQPKATRAFLHLLATDVANTDALYILGDLFEAWIGDDDDSPFHQTIIHALKTATSQGLPIYFLYGNRDFLIGRRFLKQTGCQLMADEEKISLYGMPTLVMHGDTLCTRDAAYLKARQYGRNKLLQILFLFLPLSLRKKFADKMRAKSKRHTQTMTANIMDVTPLAVEKVMKKHGVHVLIHGHTHQPATHQFLLEDTLSTRIVLGAWHERANMLAWFASGKKEWVEFDL